MKRKGNPNRPRKKTQASPTSGRKVLLFVLTIAFLSVAAIALNTKRRTDTPGVSVQQAYDFKHLTFAKDIAPIIYENCSSCHRPGQAGPFNLLTYADVKKHGKDIADVTSRHFMPPWLPDPSLNHFVGERVLRPEQIEAIKQWVAADMPEGNPSDLPPQPNWPEGWQLGKPDLVVTMPKAYTLPAEGRDIYRNFVVPLPLDSKKFVRAVDFQPGNKAVHHVFLLLDRTSQSRRLDEQEAEEGFGGMGQPGNATSPNGQFLSWRPGKTVSNTGSSWLLEKGSDLVLQMHMQTTGRPEQIQPTIAFYFTDVPPDELIHKIGFDSYAIDIPPGEQNFRAEDSFQLPVDAEVLGILPHAHYLGKKLRGFAVLPDGREQGLISINDWDFNWQSDFYYQEPLTLPKGTVIHMAFSYDNSTNNIRNPSNPPRRVQYGLQTTDEMANLAVLLRFKTRLDLDKFTAKYQYKVVRGMLEYNNIALKRDPNDPVAHAHLGKALLALGQKQEAETELKKALALKPSLDDAHYHLGLIFEENKNSAQAKEEYELTLLHNPDHIGARNNLALFYLHEGDLAAAESHFKYALNIVPDDQLLQKNLRLVQQARASRKRTSNP